MDSIFLTNHMHTWMRSQPRQVLCYFALKKQQQTNIYQTCLKQAMSTLSLLILISNYKTRLMKTFKL